MAKKKSTRKAPKPNRENLMQAVLEEEEDEEEEGLYSVLLSLLPRSRRHALTLDELLDQWPSKGVPKPTRDLLDRELNSPYGEASEIAWGTGQGTPDDPFRYYLRED